MPVCKVPAEEMASLPSDVFPIGRFNNLPGFADATPDSIETGLTEERETN